MRITQEIKLKMVEKHLLRGKSLSHISQDYDNCDISNIKYYVNLYKKFGSEVFLNREGKVYYRDTKLLAIKRVLEGSESIRSVALDFGLTDPTILQDWIKNYKNKGEAGVQDTYPRKNYVLKDERASIGLIQMYQAFFIWQKGQNSFAPIIIYCNFLIVIM